MSDPVYSDRREIVLQIISRNFEYSESIFKWCITTLTALNGSALIAMFGNDKLRQQNIESAGFYLGGGVISSIIASLIFSMTYALMAMNLSEKHWKDEVVKKDSFMKEIQEGSGGGWLALFGFIFAIASGVLLVLGCLEIAYSISNGARV